jgi:hypothetical protein
MALVPAVADLFEDIQTWRTYPLTINQIRVERIGLLRWLLLHSAVKQLGLHSQALFPGL